MNNFTPTIFTNNEDLSNFFIDLKNKFKKNIISISEFELQWDSTTIANKEILERQRSI